MRIKYVVPSSIRVIAEYVWKPDNGFVQEVREAELAANLLTYPRPEFVLADDEPLKTIGQLSDERITGLALCGIATIDHAKTMSGFEEGNVAKMWQVPMKEVDQWMDALNGRMPERDKKSSSKNQKFESDEEAV